MKRLCSMLLACVLLAGCAAPGRQTGGPAPVSYTLSQPVYPEFPQQPRLPEEWTPEEWDAYDEAYNKYMDAIQAIRGENSGLTQAEEDALTAFAVKSIPLALAGHEGENAVYSPLSLWSSLAMLAQCAEGDSRRQVLDVLNADSVEALQKTASRVWRRLYTDDGQSALILGNSIWLNDAAKGTYVQKTLDTLAEAYFAGVYCVPMGTAEADQAVTGWVRDQTRGLVGGDAPVVETQVDTLALLASSLYYKAAWSGAFEAERTEEGVFTDASGRQSRADFMHRNEDAAFLRRTGYQAASLNTQLGEMVFVLPDEGNSPKSLLQDPELLTSLDYAAEDSVWGEVQWSVPRFDADSDLDLRDALAALGVTRLLDWEKADLSALTDQDAFLSQVRQLARVKADEEGLEAAAVTLMMVEPKSAMPDPDPEVCVMDLNRPFLFLLRTQEVLLFVGIVNQV